LFTVDGSSDERLLLMMYPAVKAELINR